MTRPLPVLNVLHLPVSCLLLLLLSACGGGGGGGGSNSATSPISAAATGFSLQGSIAISAGSIVDSDINNAAQVTVSNNTPASAQRIPSFAVLGGYVNKAENGAAGPLFSAGDPLDYFSIYLYEAQSIVLDIYNADNADLDLYLLDANGQIILDSSLSATNATEQLSAPFEGQFQVLIEAFSGASSYTLRTEQTVNASSTGVRLSDAFLPNELIVRYRQPSLYTQQLYNAESSIRRHDLYRMSGDATRPMRLGINQRTPLEAQSLPADSSVAARLASGQLAFSEADFQDKYLTLQTLKALQHDKSILYAEANLQIQSAAIPNDARYDEQWNLPLIELPAAWDLTTGSNSVVVAVIDSGILSAHPDLAANLIAGYDFIAACYRPEPQTSST